LRVVFRHMVRSGVGHGKRDKRYSSWCVDTTIVLWRIDPAHVTNGSSRSCG
jgi:hypothetical protein